MHLEKALAEHDFILTEAAVIETLKRDAEITLHPELVNALLIYDEMGRRAITELINNSRFLKSPRTISVPSEEKYAPSPSPQTNTFNVYFCLFKAGIK